MVKVLPVFLSGLLAAGAGVAYSAEQIDFTKHDQNNDALLSPQEWQNVEHLVVGFEEVDLNGDGWVNRTEIHSLLLGMREQRQLRVQPSDNDDARIPAVGQQADTQLGQASFDDFDLDQDGQVSRREAKLQDAPSIANRFVIWDTDGDRLLDRTEFDQAVADLRPYEVSAERPVSDQDVRDDDFAIKDFEMWDSDGDGLLDQLRFERDIAADAVE